MQLAVEIRPDTAAFRASEAGSGLLVGDRILCVDGMALNGRILTEVIQPADSHGFEVERMQGWSGFSIEDTEVDEDADEDGFTTLHHLREIVVQKQHGQIGIYPEVHCPDKETAIVKVAKVSSGTQASACGVISTGDTIRAISGQVQRPSSAPEPCLIG